MIERPRKLKEKIPHLCAKALQYFSSRPHIHINNNSNNKKPSCIFDSISNRFFFFVLQLFSSLFIRGAQHSVWWQIIQKWKIDLDDHYLALRDQIHYCIWLIAGSAFKNITANMFEHTQNPFIQYNCMQLIARALLALCPFTTITEQQQQHE